MEIAGLCLPLKPQKESSSLVQGVVTKCIKHQARHFNVNKEI
jgi:hypothetical protein